MKMNVDFVVLMPQTIGSENKDETDRRLVRTEGREDDKFFFILKDSRILCHRRH